MSLRKYPNPALAGAFLLLGSQLFLAACTTTDPVQGAAYERLIPAGVQEQEPCQKTVDERLIQLAIPANDVLRMQFSPTYQEDADGNRRRDGTGAWIRLHSCEGALVIDLARACRVRQVYTRGDCRLPGVKSFR